MLIKDSQAETGVQTSTTDDCTKVKPPYSQTQCYKQPGCTLYAEDCLDTLRRMSTGSVDLLLQDTPFGCTQNEWDIKPNFEIMWQEWERVTKKKCSNDFFRYTAVCKRIDFKSLKIFQV